MANIQDVSPTLSNTNVTDPDHCVTGRMLSLGCAPDSSALYVGSYSNLWASDDGGQHWAQLVWPQPAPDQFDVPGSLGGWCVVDIAVALGWRVDKHPRFLAPLTKSGFADIVGFGDCGVWTALGNGDGSFQQPNVVLANFGYQAGGWRVDRHPRFVVDLNGDGCADIVGFGDAGVWTAIGNGDGTFQEAQLVVPDFGYDQGWRVDKHPRFLADLTGKGQASIVGFGEAGVYVTLNKDDGSGSFNYQPGHLLVVPDFGYDQGWRVDKHPRLLADLTGKGQASIVGFGEAGVYVTLNKDDGSGSFNYQPGHLLVIPDFGYDQGWQVDKHPRFLADLTGKGQASIVGFGEAGVYVTLNKDDGSGSFNYQPGHLLVVPDFGYDQGWRVDKHPRLLADLTGKGQASIVGFGEAGVYVTLNKDDGSGSFNYQPGHLLVVPDFGYDQGWRVDKHPRLLADLTGKGQASIAGFGEAGVLTAIGDGQGGFLGSNLVLANFGHGTIVLVLTAMDRAVGSRGIWRSTDGGANWSPVPLPDPLPAGKVVGQLEWALGSDHLVYAALGDRLAISKNAGATFEDVFPRGDGPSASVNHVAVWQNAPADPYPAVLYALGENSGGNGGASGTMFLSFDGGATWMEDVGTLPPNVGGNASLTAYCNTPKMMVISPSFPLEVYIAANGSSDCTPGSTDPHDAGVAALWRGDYTQFPFGSKQSSWEQVILPEELVPGCPAKNESGLLGQDAGNVFLATTQKGRGDLLFYGPQRLGSCVYAGPLYPTSGSDWHALDNVHHDLHGFLLSSDFEATIQNGNYEPKTGTVWLVGDGGIYWSSDGGNNFHAAHNATTLSCVDVAGVSIEGKGPALSLNEGDNDGFYSMDGGKTWSYQDYGGGDNDCSFADPLRPYSMLVFTPRWDSHGHQPNPGVPGQTVTVYETSPGSLPDASSGSSQWHTIQGPTLPANSHLWNAISLFGERGFRPIVLGLPGEDPPPQGDYVFIVFAMDTQTKPPTPTQAVLVRTQNMLDITNRNEWITTATGPGQGANVFQQGPPLPAPNVGVVQASGGHAATVFYVGMGMDYYFGNLTPTACGLWKWTAGAANWTQLVAPGSGANYVYRFFVDPYRPNLIYILADDHVQRSDDGGQTWQVDMNLEQQLTWNYQIAISPNDNPIDLDYSDSVLTDMQFDPYNPLVRFAVGVGGAFSTIDGTTWTRLLHAGAVTGRPANCYYDWISDPSDPALYVAFAGRSLMKISALP